MTLTFTPKDLASNGKSAYQRGDFPEAAEAYRAAAEGYRLAGDILTAAEMDNNRSVCLLQAGEASEALVAVEGTPELFSTNGDRRREALAYGNQAAALHAVGRLAEAETAYNRSAELLEELGEDQLRASVLQSISELQLRSGRPLDAVVSMQDGLAGLKNLRPQQRLIKKLLQMPSRFIG